MIRVDLRVDLLNHTIPSLRLLGEALNRQDRAEAFISLYQSHMDRIHQRIAAYQGRTLACCCNCIWGAVTNAAPPR